ncbi:hypothetical protein Sjap_006819 [Stephania japonica]|uniref:glutathione transferase n=1 Tax=Stephania japonica TaxID=461633 RepID=A0AAP0K6N6_9MAGN
MGHLKVHGNLLSPATQRVFVCLHEKNLDYQFINVDFSTSEHKSPPFLAFNPFGQVPAFEDGDLKLFESRAITMHIVYVYADSGITPLVSKEIEKKAVEGVWMEVEKHQFEPIILKLDWELVMKPVLGMEADAAVVAENEKKLAAVLDVYEARLKESKYLGGECFTLADLHHLPNLHNMLGTQMKKHFESRPHVKAWCDEILARPAWKKVVDMQEPEWKRLAEMEKH